MQLRRPVWLCRQVGPAGALVVAARRPAASVVVVSAARHPAHLPVLLAPRRAKYVLESPAAELNKPRRLTSRRRGLDEQELAETIEAVRMTSRDIELDLLLVEFHLVSGVRQEGALNPRLDDIDDHRCELQPDREPHHALSYRHDLRR